MATSSRDGYRDRYDDRSSDRRGGSHRNDDRRSGGYRDDRRGGYRDSDRGGYRGGDRDDRRGGYRNDDRDDRRGGYGRGDRDDRRGGYNRGDREERRGGYRGGDRDDRRGGYRGGDRDDRRGGYRGGYRNDDRDDRRGGYRGGDRDERRGGYRSDDREERRSGYRGGNRDERRGSGPRTHAQRGGKDRERRHSGPQRPGFREERINNRNNDPDIPSDVTAKDLDPSVLQDLKSLAKDNADKVGRHMVMAAMWMADDPQLALRHARAAKDRAGRVSVVRETCGIAAYHAEEWKEALAELRAARRISGGPGLIAVMADCERALGRPEKAIELAREEGIDLDAETRSELAIVVAGARRDLGQYDAAVVELQQEIDRANRTDFSAARLFYAYADALVAAGRSEEAIDWFERVVSIDHDEFLDATERLEDLRGQERGSTLDND